MAFANANAGSDGDAHGRSPARDSVVGMREQPEPSFVADSRAVEDPMGSTRIFAEMQYVVVLARVEDVGLTVDLAHTTVVVVDAGQFGRDAFERDVGHGFVLVVCR